MKNQPNFYRLRIARHRLFFADPANPNFYLSQSHHPEGQLPLDANMKNISRAVQMGELIDMIGNVPKPENPLFKKVYVNTLDPMALNTMPKPPQSLEEALKEIEPSRKEPKNLEEALNAMESNQEEITTESQEPQETPFDFDMDNIPEGSDIEIVEENEPGKDKTKKSSKKGK